MQPNLARELAQLPRTPVKDLVRRYAEIFGENTATKNKTWLVKKIAWRLQVQAEGGLSERARQRAAELANDADLRLSAPKVKTEPSAQERTTTSVLPLKSDNRLPLPGTLITREYKGTLLQVKVLPQGFEFEGDVYKSLSSVAKAITGQHCNGYHFFHLGKEEAR